MATTDLMVSEHLRRQEAQERLWESFAQQFYGDLYASYLRERDDPMANRATWGGKHKRGGFIGYKNKK